MNGILEYKSLAGTVKDIDSAKRIVTGYLSAFGNVDKYSDVVEKGAFAKSISERKDDIFFLNQHDWKQPHGKFNILKEDNFGLYFESKPLINTSYSDDLIKLYEAGIIKEHSIGYQTVISEWNSNKDIRTLKEVKLFEGSNVTLGANSKTPFTGLKALNLKEIDEQSKLLIKAIRNGSFTDDTFVLLELALKQLQLDAYELGKSLVEPSDDTQKNEPIIIEKKEIEIINEFRKSLWNHKN